MSEMIYNANEQIHRLNARIAQVADEYRRSQLKRTVCLNAGNVRRAGELSKRLHQLNTELASLASLRRSWDQAEELAQRTTH